MKFKIEFDGKDKIDDSEMSFSCDIALIKKFTDKIKGEAGKFGDKIGKMLKGLDIDDIVGDLKSGKIEEIIKKLQIKINENKIDING